MLVGDLARFGLDMILICWVFYLSRKTTLLEMVALKAKDYTYALERRLEQFELEFRKRRE